MNSTFEHIILKTQLSQSDIFGDVYDELFENTNGNAFSNPLVEDVGDLFDNILLNYENLTMFQKEMLNIIYNEFNNIRINIDPNRLKPFQHYFNEDDELLLYRETTKGLINIIINPEDCVAYSFIPNTDEKRKFYFVHQDGDFETLAYDFFSF